MSIINMIFNGEIDPRPIHGPPDRLGMWELDWYGTRAKVKRNKVIFYIRAIVESLDNHDFGTYTLTCERATKSSMMSVRVRGDKPHPHWDGYLCWGTLGAARDHAKERGDVETIGGLVETVLNSYNARNPFGGWWNDRYGPNYRGDGVSCVSCGIHIDRGDQIVCGACSSDMCYAHYIYCIRNELNYCNSCHTDVIQGTACTHCLSNCRHRPRREEHEQARPDARAFSVTLAQAQRTEEEEEGTEEEGQDNSERGWEQGLFGHAAADAAQSGSFTSGDWSAYATATSGSSPGSSSGYTRSDAYSVRPRRPDNDDLPF